VGEGKLETDLVSLVVRREWGKRQDALMPATARSKASVPKGVAITSFGTPPRRSMMNLDQDAPAPAHAGTL
jgi:hypothetical protein